jgi:hypothetical protein
MAICYINMLPMELLQSIFIEIWLSESESPVRLLLICRYWKTTALNTKVLWTKIRFAIDGRGNTSPAYITCTSSEDLLRRLLFIEGMKFDFFAGLVHRRTLKDTLCHTIRKHFRNCRSFEVTSHTPEKAIRLLTDVSSLEELKLNVFHFDEVLKLFERLDQPEARLKSLHFEGCLQGDWWKFHQMYGRLQELSFKNRSEQPRWKGQNFFGSLRALHKLNLEDSGKFYRYRDDFAERLHIPSTSLRAITLSSTSLQRFTSNSYHNLVELSIHTPPYHWYDRRTRTGDLIIFPSLRTLLISGGWHSLEEVDAPQLSVLTLEEGNSDADLSKFFLSVTHLCPTTICARRLDPESLFMNILRNFGDRSLEFRLVLDGCSPRQTLETRMMELRRSGKSVSWNGVLMPLE